MKSIKSPIKLIIYTTLISLITFGCKTLEKEPADTWFTNQEIAARVDSVLSLMTLEEKIGQLTLFTSDYDVTGPVMREGYVEDIKSGRVGAIFNAFGAEYTLKLQKIAVEETRLGIPLLFGYDVIHGHRTIFPIPLGEAASWDLDYIQKASRIAAIEASSEGLHWTFAPMIDIAPDPRWGRVAESAGEDPYLAPELLRLKLGVLREIIWGIFIQYLPVQNISQRMVLPRQGEITIQWICRKSP
jgi:beta-glucosidase